MCEIFDPEIYLYLVYTLMLTGALNTIVLEPLVILGYFEIDVYKLHIRESIINYLLIELNKSYRTNWLRDTFNIYFVQKDDFTLFFFVIVCNVDLSSAEVLIKRKTLSLLFQTVAL